MARPEMSPHGVEDSPIAEISADSRLSHDVLPVAPLEIDPSALAGAAIDINADGSPLLLTILADGGATELRASTLSASGYDTVPLPQGTGATEIVTAVDGAGACHAFYATPQAVLHSQRDPSGEWGAPDSLPAASGLSATTVPLSGEIAILGLAAGNAMLYRHDGTSWSGAKVDVGDALLGASGAQLQYLAPDAWVLFAAAGGALQIWEGTGSTVALGPRSVTVTHPVAAIMGTYYHSNSAMVLFTDAAGTLYSSVQFSDTPQSVPLSTVRVGAAAVGDDHLVRFYGADRDGTLWLLRQTGWDAHDAPVWAPYFPFDQDVAFISAPVSEQPVGTLAAVRADGSLDLIAQAQPRGPWSRTPVHDGGAPVPMQMTRYRTAVTVVDTNGVPSPGTQVTIKPSALVALEAGGQTIFASPDAPAVATSDMTGVVEFTQPAPGLSSVTFSVAAAGSEPLTVNPYAYLHSMLAGQEPIFTGDETIPPLSATTLQSATVAGQPLAPGLTPAQANAVAPAIQQAASITAPNAKPDGAGFALDLRSPAQPSFSILEHHAALAATGAADLVTTSPWDAIAQFAEDVWHAIETGVMKVVHWVVDTVNKVVSAVVQFAESVTATLKSLALEGAAAVASFVSGVFAWIKATVDKVIEWLRDLFDWGSIWRTMEAFNGFVLGGLDALAKWIETTAIDASQKFFQDLRADFDKQFSTAIAALGTQQAGPTVPSTGPVLRLPGSDAQNRWLVGKTTTNVPKSSFLDALGSDLTETLVDQAKAAIDQSGIYTDATKEWDAVEQFFHDLSTRPRALGNVLVADLLRVLEELIDVVLDAVDAIATFLLDVAADILDAIADVLDRPLPDIPVLTWLWDHVLRPDDSDDPLTLSRLASLLIALPVTLICKLATGRGPFDPPKEPVAVAASASSLKAAQKYTSLALVWIDSINDIASAAANSEGGETTPLLVFWNWVDVVANATVQVLFWPVGHPFDFDWDWSTMTHGRKLMNGAWIGYFAPIVWDGAFAAVDTNALRTRRPPPPALTYVTQGGDSAFGCVLLGVGTAGAAYSRHDHPRSSRMDIAEEVLGPLPWLTQALLLNPGLVQSSGGLTVALQCIVDLIGDIDLQAP